jgi:hypothetical protein
MLADKRTPLVRIDTILIACSELLVHSDTAFGGQV